METNTYHCTQHLIALESEDLDRGACIHVNLVVLATGFRGGNEYVPSYPGMVGLFLNWEARLCSWSNLLLQRSNIALLSAIKRRIALGRKLSLWGRALAVRKLLQWAFSSCRFWASRVIAHDISVDYADHGIGMMVYWVCRLWLISCARCHDVSEELNLRYEHQAWTSDSSGR